MYYLRVMAAYVRDRLLGWTAWSYYQPIYHFEEDE